jgi:hypothetical protein
MQACKDREKGVTMIPCTEYKLMVRIMRQDKDITFSSVNWKRFLKLCIDHKTAGIIYEKFSRSSCKVPDLVIKRLAVLKKQTFLRNSLLLEYLGEVCDLCNLCGVDLILLHSPSLFGTVYKDISLRPLQDIDLLVKPEQLHELFLIFDQLGFRHPDSLHKHLFEKNGTYFDIHTELTEAKRIKAIEDIFKFNMDRIWADSKKKEIYGIKINTLSYEDFILDSAVHMLKHCYYSILWIYDVWRLLQQQEVNFDFLFDKAVYYGTLRPLFYLLWLLHELFGMKNKDQKLSWLERKVLKLVSSDVDGRWGELFTIYLAPNWISRLKILKEIVFPSRELLKQVYHGRAGILQSLHRLFKAGFHTICTSSRLIFG